MTRGFKHMFDGEPQLVQAQLAREEEMRARGERRSVVQLTKAVSRGAAAETPAGIALTRRALAPLTEAIKEFVETANAGRAGRRNIAATLLEGVDPELAAYVALRCTLGAAHLCRSLKSAAIDTANRLATELMADQFETANTALYRAVVRTATERGLNSARQAKAVELAAKKFGVAVAPWTSSQRLMLGTKLVELVVETSGLIDTYFDRQGKKVSQRLTFTAEIDEWFRKYNEASTLTRPFFLPTVIPPKPWEDPYTGAYYGAGSALHSLVTRPFRGQLEALEKAEMSPVYDGINALQDTPWRVNSEVLAIMREAWENALPLPCLPRREDEPVPEKPESVSQAERGSEERKKWRQLVRPIHERNAKARSTRFEFNRLLSLAEESAEFDAIYFPYQLDFRGRAYATSTTLSPQGADEARGLLEFSQGKELGEAGLHWLGIHGANLWGNDKVPFEDRYQWALDFAEEAMAIAADPLNNLKWTEADNGDHAWTFLAWCFEWARAMALGKDAHTFVSHLPIALDGSCNGIQHFSAMLRDEVGGRAVNLVPGPRPEDIYGRVAERVVERLTEHAEVQDEHGWVAQSWLAFGIRRDITKRPVMVLPYGGTYKSCLDYVEAAVTKRIADGQEDPFGDHMPKARAFLASLVWASIGDVVVAAREAMSWLQAVARVVTAAGVPLEWTTPSGFVVSQAYREFKDKRIETRFCGSIVKFRSLEETDKLDRARQVSAVAPNFVHSLDASAMVLTVQAGKAKGIHSWAMIHDSYGTHAADTDLLAATLREEFVRMYSHHDVLARFREEVTATLTPEQAAEIPPIPKMGRLDLEVVKDAAYFFA